MAIREGNARKSAANPDRPTVSPARGEGVYPIAYAWGLYLVSHPFAFRTPTKKRARHNRAMPAPESDKSMQHNALTYQLFCSWTFFETFRVGLIAVSACLSSTYPPPIASHTQDKI